MDCARLFDKIGYVVTIKNGVYVQLIRSTTRWCFRGLQYGPTEFLLKI